MQESYGWVSILPPVVAIVLAIRTKQVFLSLFVGIWFGWLVINSWNPLAGLVNAIDSLVDVFADAGNTRVVIFSAMVGAVLAFVQRSGGVEGFVHWAAHRGWSHSRRRAAFLSWLIGLFLFVESSITILVRGAVARPVFDKMRISREKLAYILDSTSAPICILIPFNAWGAVVIGLLATQGMENPVLTFVQSMPFNFYAIFAVLLVLLVIVSDWNIGPMRKAELRARKEGKVLRDGAEPLISTDVIEIEPKEGVEPRAYNMLLPILVMVLMIPIGLLVTGKGDILEGSGSTSVLWGVLAALAFAAILYSFQRILTASEMVNLFFKGLGGLMPMAVLMVLAFSLGATCRELGTGVYVASEARGLVSPVMVPALTFLVSAFTAFSTGTSFGTFAIMMPVFLPVALTLGAPVAPTIAAVLGGGVFGDHCSPISDTTIISSMASASDHIDHVRTQLPYALLAGGIALVFYLLAGMLGVN
jgi:Na+/H+ antiporter NhaC